MIAEAEVARVAGVTRERLRAVRQERLVEGSDWQREAGGAVMLTDSGVGVLEAELGVDLGGMRAVVVWPGPGVRSVRVTRVTRNRRVVQAQFVERSPWHGMSREPDLVNAAGEIRLVVHDAGRLFAGAVLDARWVEADLWEMVGRGPRSRRDAVRLEHVADA